MRQPSEAAYGSSGRPREVGGILRTVHTLLAIAARPHSSTRHERAPETRHDTTVAEAVTRQQTRPLKARAHDMSVCHDKCHQVRVRVFVAMPLVGW